MEMETDFLFKEIKKRRKDFSDVAIKQIVYNMVNSKKYKGLTKEDKLKLYFQPNLKEIAERFLKSIKIRDKIDTKNYKILLSPLLQKKATTLMSWGLTNKEAYFVIKHLIEKGYIFN